MDNEELLNEFKKHTEMLAKQTEEKFEKHTNEIIKQTDEEFKRHMGILLVQHEKEIKTVGEGHGTLLRKLDEFKSEFHEHKESTERGLDRLTIEVVEIKEKLDKDYGKRLKRVEEKVGI